MVNQLIAAAGKSPHMTAGKTWAQMCKKQLLSNRWKKIHSICPLKNDKKENKETGFGKFHNMNRAVVDRG